jgi:hypothetical protein
MTAAHPESTPPDAHEPPRDPHAQGERASDETRQLADAVQEAGVL